MKVGGSGVMVRRKVVNDDSFGAWEDSGLRPLSAFVSQEWHFAILVGHDPDVQV